MCWTSVQHAYWPCVICLPRLLVSQARLPRGCGESLARETTRLLQAWLTVSVLHKWLLRVTHTILWPKVALCLVTLTSLALGFLIVHVLHSQQLRRVALSVHLFSHFQSLQGRILRSKVNSNYNTWVDCTEQVSWGSVEGELWNSKWPPVITRRLYQRPFS